MDLHAELALIPEEVVDEVELPDDEDDPPSVYPARSLPNGLETEHDALLETLRSSVPVLFYDAMDGEGGAGGAAVGGAAPTGGPAEGVVEEPGEGDDVGGGRLSFQPKNGSLRVCGENC